MTPLHGAVLNNSISVINLLLANPHCDANAKNQDHQAPLHLASKKNFTNIANMLMDDEQVIVNDRDANQRTPLHIAALNDNAEMIKLLLAKERLGMNARDYYGQTSLHIATWSNSMDAMKLLLADEQCEVNAVDKQQKTPLYYAIFFKCIDAIKLLLADKRCEVAKDVSQKTPLHWSVSLHLVDVKQLYRENPFLKINAGDKDRQHLLLDFADFEKGTEVLKALLSDARFDVNARDQYQRTPLHSAAGASNAEAVSILLADSRCKINAQDKNKQTPLHSAVAINSTEAAKILLSDKRCDVNARDTTTRTALLKAAFCRNAKPIKLLLADKRCEVNATDKNGESAITILIRGAQDVSKFETETVYLDCLNLLASKHGTIEACSYTLPLAIEMSSTAACKTLIKYGADVGSCFPDGESSIHTAIRKDSLEKVKLLCAHGASLDTVWRGMKPSDMAKAIGCNKDMISLLQHSKKSDVLSPLNVLSQNLDKNSKTTQNRGKIRKKHNAHNKGSSNILTTTIQKPSANRHQNQLLHNIVATAHHCNASLEKQRIKKHLVSCFGEISNRIAKKNPHLAFKLVLAGSSMEGSKTFKPDEFDVVCEFLEATLIIKKGKNGHKLICQENFTVASLYQK